MVNITRSGFMQVWFATLGVVIGTVLVLGASVTMERVAAFLTLSLIAPALVLHLWPVGHPPDDWRRSPSLTSTRTAPIRCPTTANAGAIVLAALVEGEGEPSSSGGSTWRSQADGSSGVTERYRAIGPM